MNIQIYAIASKSTDWFEENFSMYQNRLPAHINLKLTTIPLAYRNKNSPIKAAVKKEGELLLKRISSKDTLIVMDENGNSASMTHSLGMPSGVITKEPYTLAPLLCVVAVVFNGVFP